MNNEKQRAAFEAEYIKRNPNAWLARGDDGRYDAELVNVAYEWFLAGAGSVPAIPELRQISEVKVMSDFTALVRFQATRPTAAFVRGLEIARGRK